MSKQLLKANIFIVALLFLVSILSLLNLPALISYDGHYYIRMAEILFTRLSFTEWFWIRTPLYPLQIKLSLFLFGENATSLVIANLFLSSIAILIIFNTSIKYLGCFAAMILAIVLILMPSRIAYSQAVLTESGAFLFITLSWLFFLEMPKSLIKSILIAIALAVLGFYYRLTLIYVLPLLAFVVAIRFVPKFNVKLFSTISFTICFFSIFLVCPWLYKILTSHVAGVDVLLGKFKQGIVPQEAFSDVNAANEYNGLVKKTFTNNGLKFDGLSDAQAHKYFPFINAEKRQELKSYKDMLIRPKVHFYAFARSFLALSGLPQHHSKNELYRNRALLLEGSNVLAGPEHLDREIRQRFERIHTTSSFGVFVSKLSVFYEILIFLGFFCSLLLLPTRFMPVALLPFVYVFFHALLFLSVDRYSFPVQPIVIANYFIALSFLKKSKSSVLT